MALAALVAWVIRSTLDDPDGPVETRGGATAAASELDSESPGAGSAQAVETTVRVGLPGGDLTGLGSLIAQVVEVDGCIDPTGTELVLSGAVAESRARIQPDGGATFLDVRFEPGVTRFRLRTSVVDRKCFPESFSIDTSDLSGSPPSAGVSVALVHLHLLSGLVRDASSRKAIEAATLEVDSFAISSTVSDAEGAFHLNLPEPEGTLIVRARGYQELLWQFPEQTGQGRWLPDQRDFELLPDQLTCWLLIKVVDEQGRPAVGAELSVADLGTLPIPQQALVGLNSLERVEFLQSLEAEVNGFGRVPGEHGAESDWLQLDDQGECLVQAHLPGDIRVTVLKGTAVASAVRTMRPGQNGDLLLTLSPGLVLGVHVVSDGRSVPRVPIGLKILENHRGLVSFSDEDGQARFEGLSPSDEVVLDVVPGLSKANGERDSFWQASALRLKLPDQVGPIQCVELEIQALQHRRISGRVLDQLTRQPLRAHLVWTWMTPAKGMSTETCDAEGRFSLFLADGHSFLVRADGYRDRVVESRSLLSDTPEILLIPLEEGDTRLGLDLVDAEGRPLPFSEVSFNLTVESSEGRPLARQVEHPAEPSDSEGRVLRTFSLQPAERLSILAVGVAQAGHLKGRGKYELQAGQSLEGVLTLRPTCAISGQVEWPHGGRDGTGVRALWASDGVDERFWSTGRVEPDGRFRLEDLSPGSGKLLLQAAFHGALKALDLPESGLEDVQVRLESMREFEVRVIDADSRIPVRRPAVLSPFESSGTRQNSVVVPASGQVTVRVLAPGYRPRAVEISGNSDAPGPIEVALERAW